MTASGGYNRDPRDATGGLRGRLRRAVCQSLELELRAPPRLTATWKALRASCGCSCSLLLLLLLPSPLSPLSLLLPLPPPLVETEKALEAGAGIGALARLHCQKRGNTG